MIPAGGPPRSDGDQQGRGTPGDELHDAASADPRASATTDPASSTAPTAAITLMPGCRTRLAPTAAATTASSTAPA